MPFFSRREKKSNIGAAPPPPVPLPVGIFPCSEKGCANANGVQCAYVDRRTRRCETAWCPQHYFMVDRQPYCRRHARIIAAIPKTEIMGDMGLPEVMNRAPSLANWMADALEPAFLQLLWSLCRQGTTQSVESEPVHAVRTADGARHWYRSWKLFDHTGTIAKITIDVDEDQDDLVLVRVGSRIVATARPPWIDRRRRGEVLDPEDDQRERQAFYAWLFEQAKAHVIADATRNR